VRNLEAWAETVAAKLDTLTYDKKRRTLDALGVKVLTYLFGTVDETDDPTPRWVVSITPTLSIPLSQSEIVYRSTHLLLYTITLPSSSSRSVRARTRRSRREGRILTRIEDVALEQLGRCVNVH
jgi:hypothetical protein